LSDPKKKELYDQYGEAGLRDGGGGGGGGGFHPGQAEDIFAQFFGRARCTIGIAPYAITITTQYGHFT
jgi:DnaJ-class molecular chaperone